MVEGDCIEDVVFIMPSQSLFKDIFQLGNTLKKRVCMCSALLKSRRSLHIATSLLQLHQEGRQTYLDLKTKIYLSKIFSHSEGKGNILKTSFGLNSKKNAIRSCDQDTRVHKAKEKVMMMLSSCLK